MAESRHISVCICSFKRPDLLRRTLEALRAQKTDGRITFGVVVADNDAAKSAESTVREVASQSPFPIVYSNEPRQNIALARNKALEHATGEFIAFIDDDEFPVEGWLLQLVATCDKYKVSGVLGPVRPHFDNPPPKWIIRGGFCERPEHPTGTPMEWEKCRTGNVLFRREILKLTPEAFKEEFGTGGEDKDFFKRMSEKGCTFVWCNEAPAYEVVPPQRWTRSYMLSRAMLRGRNILRHPKERPKLLAISAVAVPLYSVMLPFTLLLGQHVFMKYGIKFCDHLGRVLTALHLNPVTERQM
jgi:succinoglycan biosynthesis protein ExoM